MAETEKDCAQSAKRSFRIIVGIIASLFPLSPILYYWLKPTATEQLAEINAARAIPDNENAALVYAQILRDPCETVTMAELCMPLSDADRNRRYTLSANIRKYWELTGTRISPNVYTKPWSRTQHPKLAMWLDEQNRHLSILAEAVELKHCVFPIELGIDSEQPSWGHTLNSLLSDFKRILRTSAMLKWSEGRVPEIIKGMLTVVSIGRHLQKQPEEYFMNGLVHEKDGLAVLNQLLLHAESRITESDLDRLRAFCIPLQDQWDSIHPLITHVRSLRYNCRKHRYFAAALRTGDMEEVWDILTDNESDYAEFPTSYIFEAYNKLLTHRRRHRLIIEIRAYRNQHGHWPQNLAEIVTQLPKEALQEILEITPFIQFLPDGSFLMCCDRRLYEDRPPRLPPQDIQIAFIDHSPPSLHDLDIINCYSHRLFYQLFRDKRTEVNPWIQLRKLLPLSAPVLVEYLKHAETDYRKRALNILSELADPNYRGRDPNNTFLPELIDGYRQESCLSLQEAYIILWGRFQDIPPEQARKISAILADLLTHSENQQLRYTAAQSLLQIHPLEALHILINNRHWFDDEGHFGERENSQLIGQMDLAAEGEDIGEYRTLGKEEMLLLEEMMATSGHTAEMLDLSYTPENPSETLDNLRRWWQDNQDAWNALDAIDPNSLKRLQEDYRKKYRTTSD